MAAPSKFDSDPEALATALGSLPYEALPRFGAPTYVIRPPCAPFERRRPTSPMGSYVSGNLGVG
jgi:hypothetical protein